MNGDRCLFCGLLDCPCTAHLSVAPYVSNGECACDPVLDRVVTDPRPRSAFPTIIGLGDLMAEVRADLQARRDGAS